MREPRERLYKKGGRFYADFRDFSDVGGKREALIPDGKRSATKAFDTAYGLAKARLKELEARRRGEGNSDPLLVDYAKRHLRIKSETRRPRTVERDELSLRHVRDFFGRETRLSEITVARLSDYVSHRRQQPGSKPGTTISGQTLRHELHALSSLFKRAVAEGKAERNPVLRLPEKPQIDRSEAAWLEPGEAARLLHAAEEADASPHSRATPFMYPLLATFLYTGGRKGGVFGLLVKDVRFEDEEVHFRGNHHRPETTKMRRRVVPLWPDLKRILSRYVEDFERTSGLLFPAENGGMLSDVRGSLGSAVEKAGIPDEKDVTLTTLRHTYAATRMQTTDQGRPVSPYTVMRELGHKSLQMILDRYGHLQKRRNRSPVVEYQEADVIPLEARLKNA